MQSKQDMTVYLIPCIQKILENVCKSQKPAREVFFIEKPDLDLELTRIVSNDRNKL